MPRHLAFLRAVNLGRVRKVPMAELRERLTGAGFTDVETHLQTGNIALTSTMRSGTKVEAAIEDLLSTWCGFEVPTMVRSPRELHDLARQVASIPPLLTADARRYVAFVKSEPSRSARDALTAYDATPERARVVGRDVLLEYDSGFPNAKLAGARLEKLAGSAVTTRDLKVVRTLDERWSTT
ncbi:DUF1697 domain-containing protein [Knoellia aerolata]|uniref:DUF1697 domain-containing protein n=1 Tax=Knoellia aerolata DSM 18566 TaxID=1385519 RepID=A0A0A0JQK1_9MICO|nr:DUF1697 domain-containing protein [Knoellia aerolata]KGN39755.1 hypothetical protein N801_19130 [Knoellia aerolata DSM 18566]